MRNTVFALALCGGFATTSAVAETSAVGATQAAPTSERILPANTEVIVRTNEELTSKGGAMKVGYSFRLTVAYDVKVEGITLIPAGTTALGEVSKRTGKGVFGKSGKLEIELQSIDLNGQRIPISGKYRQAGEGNTLAAVGAVVLSAPLLFVTGKSAIIPRGKELAAYTMVATSIPVR